MSVTGEPIVTTRGDFDVFLKYVRYDSQNHMIEELYCRYLTSHPATAALEAVEAFHSPSTNLQNYDLASLLCSVVIVKSHAHDLVRERGGGGGSCLLHLMCVQPTASNAASSPTDTQWSSIVVEHYAV